MLANGEPILLDLSGVKFAVPSMEKSRLAIRSLDFTQMIKKICSSEPGRAVVWEESAARAAVEVYKNWLWLVRKYSHEHPHIVPSIEIDEIWHNHILDTVRYYPDCIEIFGQFVHHNPYAGSAGAADLDDLVEKFNLTKNLYQKEFGEALPSFIITGQA